ncbi:GNAT family N-acetyltransferase [Dactylosporangium sp. CA-152071]|uniref:GNAT family N-acetyltransferase n=1 Tax=Dactylosporangium sp. CA-152071 TaxID=3239933 RepID=UPI003D8B94AE
MTSEPAAREWWTEDAMDAPNLLVIKVGPSGQRARRARATLQPDASDEHLWHLRNVATDTGFERQGWGRHLLEAVRAWAAPGGFTVRTLGATNEADGFYVACGCRLDDDVDEYIVAGPGL